MRKRTKKLLKSKHLRIAIPLLLIAGLVALHVYQLQELRGLRTRVHTLEYANNEQQAEEAKYAEEKVDYEVVSKEPKSLRVEDMSAYSMTQTEPTYVNKKVIVYRVKVTNNTSWTYDYSEDQIRGKTATGGLVASEGNYMVHPDDRQGPEYLSLAPGGVGEIYVYISAEQNIVDLYYPNNITP